jgi:hypothetical protein
MCSDTSKRKKQWEINDCRSECFDSSPGQARAPPFAKLCGRALAPPAHANANESTIPTTPDLRLPPPCHWPQFTTASGLT